MREDICFITASDHGFLIGKLRHLFEMAGIDVHMCSDDTTDIKNQRGDARIFVYYARAAYSRVDATMAYLSNMCYDEHKSLYLIGGESFLERALASDRCNAVSDTYVHPVDSGQIVKDIRDKFVAHSDFERRKDLLIVDDDDDFLELMDNWLGAKYDVIGVNTGVEVLDRIREYRCDLILLDYEVSDMNGYELMEKVRSNPLTADIPLIFLTDINDKESVMNIIRRKPDGYLLKTTRKAELLDVLERFFAETILGRRNPAH